MYTKIPLFSGGLWKGYSDLGPADKYWKDSPPVSEWLVNKLLPVSKMCSGRHRWVIYTMEMNGKKTLWDVDGSMVPAEWYDLQCYRINMNNDNMTTWVNLT